jgi:hypothetical protein
MTHTLKHRRPRQRLQADPSPRQVALDPQRLALDVNQAHRRLAGLRLVVDAGWRQAIGVSL